LRIDCSGNPRHLR